MKSLACIVKLTLNRVLGILSRCQTYIHRRWRKKALEMKAKHDSYPSFKDFVEFVKLVALEACDPVYGIQQSKSQVKGVSYNTVLSQHHQQIGPRLPVATQANHNVVCSMWTAS